MVILVTTNLITKASVKKIESIQYQAALAITGEMHWNSKIKLYNELEIESVKLRQWFKRLC